MNQILPPRCLLAGIGCGWQVRELLDGSVHLKLRETGLLFCPGEFVLFAALLEQAGRSACSEDGTLACMGAQRLIAYDAQQRCLVVQFDQIRLILSPRDGALLIDLCRRAVATLQARRSVAPEQANLDAAVRWN